jgi:hypothetical protein
MLVWPTSPSTTNRKTYGVDHWTTTSITLIAHPKESPKQKTRTSHNDQPQPPAHGGKKTALTFGTLLSSQGADAHRFEPSGPSRGNSHNVSRLASRCQTGVCVPHHPPIPLDRGLTAGPRSGARPVRRRSSGVRGVNHGRRAVAAESNPLPSLFRTVVRDRSDSRRTCRMEQQCYDLRPQRPSWTRSDRPCDHVRPP